MTLEPNFVKALVREKYIFIYIDSFKKKRRDWQGWFGFDEGFFLEITR